MMLWSRRWFELLLLLSLVGCAGTSSQMAPVERPGGADYVVRKGDNLHAIAFQRGVTVRDIVVWNHISNPNLIHPGQRLRMSPAANTSGAGKLDRVAVVKVVPAQRVPPVTAVPSPVSTVSTAARTPPPASAAASSATAMPSPARSKPVPVAASVKPVPAAVASTGAPSASNLVSKSYDGVRWTWPTQGKLIKGFSASSEGKKGINIAGREGQRVLAAASGKIVYAGSGLGGYGQLIIIEHNKKYLSAYAHNSVLKAKEGDRVTIGQTIAAMGKTGTSRVMLHFEIRRDGKAVDPVRYLPAQNP